MVVPRVMALWTSVMRRMVEIVINLVMGKVVVPENVVPLRAPVVPRIVVGPPMVVYMVNLIRAVVILVMIRSVVRLVVIGVMICVVSIVVRRVVSVGMVPTVLGGIGVVSNDMGVTLVVMVRMVAIMAVRMMVIGVVVVMVALMIDVSHDVIIVV